MYTFSAKGRALALALALVLMFAAITALTLSAAPSAQGSPDAHARSGASLVRADDADVPMPPPPSHSFFEAYKSASKNVLAPGQTLSYTILLFNSSMTDTIAQVTDPVPSQMIYVPDSATGGGVYDSGAATLSWSAVNVPAKSSLALSFAVTATADVTVPTLVINTATITASNFSIQRQAWVLLAPPLTPVHSLYGSFKSASRYALTWGDVLTYTINLHNSGADDVTADVTDPVPAQMSYLPGSATGGGNYDSNTATLSWNAVSVPAGGDVSLSFAVTATANVVIPTPVINKATIAVGGDSLQRAARVLLLPSPVITDSIPPVVHSLTIDEQDVLTSPTVTLHISATDNIGVKWMYLREWYLATAPWPHWQSTSSSGWIPYQADYTWTLAMQSGAHFMGVWVADDALNISHPHRQMMDFASLVLPGATVRRFGMVPYLVHYEAGVTVSAVLTPTTGDADLYVWYPYSMGRPDQRSTQPLTATEVISFTTPRADTYLFLVYGYTAATYNLSIAPGGGPQGWTPPGPGIHGIAPSAINKPDDLTSEPVLTQSGLDPLDIATSPSGPFMVYLPLIAK